MPKGQLSFSLGDADQELIKLHAADQGVSVSYYIASAVRARLTADAGRRLQQRIANDPEMAAAYSDSLNVVARSAERDRAALAGLHRDAASAA